MTPWSSDWRAKSLFTFLKSDNAQTSAELIDGKAVYLRPPLPADWQAWAEVRASSRAFLKPWEPTWSTSALTRTAYRQRLRIQARERRDNSGYRFFIFRSTDDALVGGVNLSNIQSGVAMSCGIGYWIGKDYARQDLMRDAVSTLLPFVFDTKQVENRPLGAVLLDAFQPGWQEAAGKSAGLVGNPRTVDANPVY